MAQEQSVKPKVFFDLDGTLLDVSERNYQVYSEVTKECGGQPLNKKTYWDLKRKKAKWPQLLPLSKLAADIETDFLQKFIPKVEDPKYLQLDVLQPEALNVVKTIAADHECRLVSLRRNADNLQQQLSDLALSPYFTEVLSGHSETDGFDKKIELLKSRLSEGGVKDIIIGDTEADIVTGKTLGMTTIAVAAGIRDEQFLRALEPDYTVDHIGQILDLSVFKTFS